MRKILLAVGMALMVAVPSLRGQTPVPTVHAILFYSPTCGHCHQLINEHLIPMQDEYGRSLTLLALDTSLPWANNLYYETIRHFELPQEDWVVPIMVLGDEVLIGGIDIPERLTRAMEEDLPNGGIDLPDYPALVRLLREQNALDPRFPDRLIIRQDLADPQASDSASAQPEADPDPTPPDSVTEPADAEAVAGSDEARPPGTDSTPGAEGQGEGTPDAGATEGTPAVESEGDQPVTSDPDSAGGQEAEQAPAPSNETAPEGAPAAEAPAGAGTIPTGSLDLSATARSMESMGMWERFNLDPKGNSLSVLVLLAMLVSLALKGYPRRTGSGPWPGWVVPVLVLAGAAVASYLSFIEVTQSEAVCGPVGDCNTVNQSPYATLFGILPVGILGLMGYAMILMVWFVHRATSGDLRRKAALGLWLLALFGTLFSVYLTFLEPFVIGATCIWCLSSAVVMTLLLWASAPLAADALAGGGAAGPDPENAHG